ncbi:MAG TPA: primosomal protein N' [Syntrophales bacterium]|nr:primosomal protein N' [Syntrophales bacterium]HOX93862.1 primosomal protein N' [Syntrophales bacterium]HPI56430.1 primosomal protein N' [Syntrophales bacterium]HPN24182.1 primosomal protein N' [Syntrophales bacterium]HQM28535.1 primosomal protein N' [Syntrophales bacterium]
MFVEVAVSIRSPKTFSYEVPGDLEPEVAVGKRVLVPLGKRSVTGYILRVPESVSIGETKKLLRVLDTDPLFSEEDLRFYQWAADYYLYPLGKMLGEILPGGIDMESRRWVTRTEEEHKDAVPAGTARKDLSGTERRILSILRDTPAGLSVKQLCRKMGRKLLTAELKSLRDRKLIRLDERLTQPRLSRKKEKVVSAAMEETGATNLPASQKSILDLIRKSGCIPLSEICSRFKNGRQAVQRLARKGLVQTREREAYRSPECPPEIHRLTTGIRLNADQEAALQEIVSGLSSGRFAAYLLHGVTGSGKTEIYLQAISEVLKQQGSVIYLVPEIALTPQLQSRLMRRFGDGEIAVLHSGISPGARYDQWRRIQRGDLKIILGARSAIFAPARDLKLIVVDEEHDSSYKQDERLPYHARDLAIVRAKMQSAAAVLGSATPGIQTYFNTREKSYRYLSLPRRVEERPLPQVRIVDMKNERDENGRIRILSGTLRNALEETLRIRRQSILFLNRRGFTTFMHCPECAHVFRCPSCDVSLTHHQKEGILRCHYCDYFTKVPSRCPSCQKEAIQSFGLGTERLEEEVLKCFPRARVRRMDSDVTARKGTFVQILKDLHDGEIDILIGTQMIAKGHDYPNVTLVGVVSADTALNIPDFRASEKTFQLLTQVSGRGGRGDLPGRVIIQTLNPSHYAIERTQNHDYRGFFNEEIAARQGAGYPPFSRMIQLLVTGLDRYKTQTGAERIVARVRRLLQSQGRLRDVSLIGPVEAPIARIRGRHRWQILLKGQSVRQLQQLTRQALSGVKAPGCDIRVDVDPVNFM